MSNTRNNNPRTTQTTNARPTRPIAASAPTRLDRRLREALLAFVPHGHNLDDRTLLQDATTVAKDLIRLGRHVHD